MVSKFLLMFCLVATCTFVTQADGREAGKLPIWERDGRSEALADIAAKRPARLYVHRADGVIPTAMVPGVANCSPGSLTPGSAVQFVPLPEADWAEGEDYTDEEARVMTAAHMFARNYNRTMLRGMRSAIISACPEARASKGP